MQQQRALAAHQARLLATKKPLGSGVALRTALQRPDSSRKGGVQKKRKQGNIRLSDKVRGVRVCGLTSGCGSPAALGFMHIVIPAWEVAFVSICQ